MIVCLVAYRYDMYSTWSDDAQAQCEPIVHSCYAKEVKMMLGIFSYFLILFTLHFLPFFDCILYWICPKLAWLWSFILIWVSRCRYFEDEIWSKNDEAWNKRMTCHRPWRINIYTSSWESLSHFAHWNVMGTNDWDYYYIMIKAINIWKK